MIRAWVEEAQRKTIRTHRLQGAISVIIAIVLTLLMAGKIEPTLGVLVLLILGGAFASHSRASFGTIQAWLTGTPEYLRQAQQGLLTKVAPSTTVSLAGATLIATDFIICTTIGAAGAVKVLGGQDTGNGPCQVGDTLVIANHTGQNVTIFPNNSTGTVKNGGAGVGFLIATGLTAFLNYFGSDNWTLNAS